MRQICGGGGGLLEGAGIIQGLTIAPFTLGFWENHFHRHVWPAKPWGDNRLRLDCVPVHRTREQEIHSTCCLPLHFGVVIKEFFLMATAKFLG